MTSVPGAVGRSGWYYGWNIVAVCMLSQIAANALPINTISLFLAGWSADLHASASTLLLGMAAVGVLSALLSPIAGIFADKVPSRQLFGLGLAGIALFCIAVSFVSAPWQLITLYALLLPPALVLCTALTANAVVSRWFVRHRGLAIGLTSFGLAMGGAVIPPVIARLEPEFGWRAIWRVAGIGIAVIVAPLVVWVLRDRPTEREGLDFLTGDALTQSHHHAAGGASDLSWREVLARRDFWILIVTYLPMLAVYGVCLQNLGPIAKSHGLSQQTAGVLLSAFSISQLAATLIAGLLSDRFGNRRPLAALALLTATGGVLLAFGESGPAISLATVLCGLAGGMWPLLASALAGEFGASGMGRAFGLLMLFLPLGAFAPAGVTRLQESTGSYAPGLTGLAAVAFAGGLACLFFLREKPSGAAEPG